MIRRGDETGVVEALSAIPHLPRTDLLDRWEAAYGRPAPKGISRRLLEYSAAYQVQVAAYGGLKPTVRRKLERRSTSKQRRTENPKAPKTKAGGLSPGTRLIREWHGRTYQVEVMENGYCFDGRRFHSLSEIARDITGTRWSGPRFFGL